ncbi:PH domain-containing protein [Natronosalvus halobius]|uniref:PH domain-containing protein n=1 Tax=Natronosalvus halobius TaxID=2953746 RepID=UPI00209E39CE|nr:PH domain-containing protein [Natronosalvus halobius]USZ72910.1 PH domain-containing protein [Natronosalvus halobius]
MKRLHPSSVIVRSLSRSLNLGFLFFVVGLVSSPGEAGANLFVIGVFVLGGILVGILYELAYYERFRYAVADDTFDVVSGVVSRRDREVPLHRVQNVDVRQTALHRLFGIAAVHVETAGGSQTEITLRYVDEAEARALTRRLRTGAGVGAEPDDVDREGPTAVDTDAGRAPREPDGVAGERHQDAERTLFRIKPKELAILSVFTIDPGASLLGGLILSFASGFDPTTLVPIDLLESDLPGTGVVAILWAGFLFLLAAWILSALLTLTRYYGFRLTRVGDELYYERGLVQRYSGTIPLEKVQTLTITESVPYRWFGYASLAVETAGYGPEQSDSRGTESAIPLAEVGRVVALARSIEPFEASEMGETIGAAETADFTGSAFDAPDAPDTPDTPGAPGAPDAVGAVDAPADATDAPTDDSHDVDFPPLERPPLRARERYAVRYIAVITVVLAAGYVLASRTEIVRDWYAFAPLLFLVPPAAHLKWRNRGYRVGEAYFYARTGFWRRSTKIVPAYRVQSVLNAQTVFQRRRRLASVTADTASSATLLGRPATAHDIDAERAFEVQWTLEQRLQEQRRVRSGEGSGSASD